MHFRFASQAQFGDGNSFRCAPRRKAEGLGKRNIARTRVNAHGDDVMTGSTEAIGVGGVGEAAKNVFQAEGPRGVLGYLDGEIGLLDSLLADAVESYAEPT